MRTRNSAAYKGVYALLMKGGCQDFKSGDPVNINRYFDEDIDIHHIFPVDWCERRGNVERDVYNGIINKTAISRSHHRGIILFG
jgi:hypothetical protein